MAQYKVKVIGMLVRGNKMAKYGEIVDEVNLLTDAKVLVKDGFVEAVVGNAPPAATNESDEAKADEAKADEAKADEAKKNPLIEGSKKK